MNCRLMLLTLSLALFAVAPAEAQMMNDSTSPAVGGTQSWQAGWDNFGEPINLTSSNIIWALAPTRKLTVTFTLGGATPHISCIRSGAMFSAITFPPPSANSQSPGATGPAFPSPVNVLERSSPPSRQVGV